MHAAKPVLLLALVNSLFLWDHILAREVSCGCSTSAQAGPSCVSFSGESCAISSSALHCKDNWTVVIDANVNIGQSAFASELGREDAFHSRCRSARVAGQNHSGSAMHYQA